MAIRLDESGVLRCVEWERLEWLEHGFGTRRSEGWLPAESCADLVQVHGAGIVRAEAPGARFREGDALVASRAGLWIRVRTADCLPVLLADERRRAVAAVHCGWRGVRLELAAATVRRMGAEFGTVPSDVLAVIGPGIGACCFEVGPEVASEFQSTFPERDDLDRRTKLDLEEAVARQLAQAGVDEGRVARARLCTHCGAELFHSFRRDGTLGRMEAGIRVTECP
ncbi:MAG: peptidoglycan editing factor PgeF [Bryobacterales bacterium]|nr:peptidoglycan editing factor PgeF [Bryobacterales bacterium]